MSDKSVALEKTAPLKIDLQRHAPVVLFLLLVIALTFVNRNFLSAQAMYNLMLQASSVGIIALGAMLVLISAGIDFTAGHGMALAGVVGGYFYVSTGNSLIALVIACLAAGAILGLVNGTLISRLKLPPFIATLAMMTVCLGLALMISDGRRIQIENPLVLAFGQSRLFGVIPPVFVAYLAVVGIIYLLLNHTKFGVYVYAIGGNEDAVKYAGINIAKYKMLIYIVAGLCYGVAAIVVGAKVTIITPSISSTLLLDGIASAVIGGTSITGGRGRVFGTVIGTLIILLISTLLTFLRVPSLLRDALRGAIIIGILLFDVAMVRLAKRK